MSEPVGLLVGVAVPAMVTATALSPLPRTPRWGWWRWATTLLVNEQPVLVILWLLIINAFAVLTDEADNAIGQIALVLTLATVGGLLVLTRRGWRTRATVTEALTRALAPTWPACIPADRRKPLAARPTTAHIVFVPFWLRHRGVVRIRNQPYGDGTRANLLDVYRPRETPIAGPMLLHLHGGGFRHGAKSREARAMLYRLAAHGWVCLSANYRLGPAGQDRGALIDVKRAVDWARRHGPSYGGDSGTVLIGGSSAGAHLAVMAALTANQPEFQPGFEGSDTSVAAAIGLYGYYGVADGDAPENHLPTDIPPMFVAHGDQDTNVRIEQARRFVERLTKVSNRPVVYVELTGGQHSFDLFHSLRFDAVVDGVEAFAEWVRASGPET